MLSRILTCLVFCALARAPAHGGPATPDVGAPPGARIVLATFFAEFLPGLRAITDDFEAETGIALEVQGVPYNAYEMWLHARFLGENAPEVLLLENPGVAWRYGQAGLMLKFDDLVEEPNPLGDGPAPWKSAFRQPHIQQSRDTNGHLYLIPYTQYAVGFFYNKKQYDAFGLAPPDTWQGLLDNLDRLKTEGYTAYLTAVREDDAQTVWIASLLLECFERVHVPRVNLRTNDPDWEFDYRDRQCTIDERIDISERIVAFEKGIIDPARSPEYAEVARVIKDMSRRWRPDFLSVSGDTIYQAFATGKTAHMMNGTWFIGDFGEMQEIMAEVSPETVFEYGIFPFPEVTPATSELPRAGGINQNAGLRACLMATTQPREPWRERAAVLLCHYLTLPRVARKVFENSDVYDIPAIDAVPPRAQATALLPREQYAYLPPSNFVGYDAEALSDFWTLWQGYLVGTLTLDAFLEQLSRSHRRSLRRQAVIYRDEADVAFIGKHLGPGTEWEAP